MVENINGTNGKWQLAFWIVTGFLAFILSVGIPAIIANDTRIEKKVDDFKDCIKDDITQIKVSVAKIEQAISKD